MRRAVVEYCPELPSAQREIPRAPIEQALAVASIPERGSHTTGARFDGFLALLCLCHHPFAKGFGLERGSSC